MKKPTRARARTRSVNEFSSARPRHRRSRSPRSSRRTRMPTRRRPKHPPIPRTTNDEPLEEVLVSGIRHAIAASIEVKREEMSIVEVVSAEEIGKLPDVSIAESIARLPGLAAQRVNGRAQSISIRGLAPDFTTTLLNGRQQASSGDNRAVEFDQYPSELLSERGHLQDAGREHLRLRPVGHRGSAHSAAARFQGAHHRGQHPRRVRAKAAR